MLEDVDCPSFPGPDHAWTAFFQDDFSAAASSGLSRSELGVIRVASNESWFGPVRVTPTELVVEIQGCTVPGTRLELCGTANRIEREIEAPGPVVLPLPDGLPGNAWLWLKRGTNWLDYRAFNPQWTPPDALAEAEVRFDVPVDPTATLEAFLSAGEGPNAEFKSAIPEPRPDAKSKRTVFKTDAAFATGSGGVMVFGTDPNELDVCGLGSEDPKKLRDRLGNLIRETVIPTPNFSINDYTIDSKSVLVLTVEKSPSPPYAGPRRRSTDRFSVR